MLPVLIVICLAIIVFNRYSPFYRQTRPGLGGKKFTCLKFQTYTPPNFSDRLANKQDDKKRETKLGLFLRDHGLDEVPQLLNIIGGSMSLVGPRPYLEITRDKILTANPDMKKVVSEWWIKRQKVRPGLSGWHQIHSMDSGIIRYDMEYLENPTARKRLEVFFVSIYILFVGKNRFFKVGRKFFN